MPNETEAKFPVKDFAVVLKALRKAGAKLLCAVVQDDHYLDTPDMRLMLADTAVRLRLTRRRRGDARLDARPLLTFKGPTARGARIKVRHEVQTHLDNPQAILEALGACGVKPMLILQKRRRSYRLGRCQVELDELPLAGRFVEIEGPSAAHIERARRRLGLAGPACTDHYVNLVLARCPRAGKQCLTVTFAKCGRCGRR